MRRFLFRLALHLGMTVGELEQRMDSRELSEWFAFSRIEPWPEDKIEYAVGTLSALTANMNRKKGSKAYKPKDFMMPIQESRHKRKRQTVDDMKRKFAEIANAFKKKKG